MTFEDRTALTLVVPVRASTRARLASWLAEAGPQLLHGFRRVTSLGHGALSVLPNGAGAELLLETTFEGELGRHLAELWGALGGAFRDLAGESGIAELAEGDAFFRLARERAVRVDAWYLAHRAARTEAPRDFRDWAAAFGLAPLFELDERARAFRAHREQPRVPDAPEDVWLGERAPFAALFALRPGALRERALRRALGSADALFAAGEPGFRAFGPGGLAGLHTTRLVLLPGGRLLVTGLVDGPPALFFDRVAVRRNPVLAAIFMHTQAFPPTRFLAFGGARRHAEFRRWIRQFQLPAGIWYSVYPALS
jgi:hypothetical protein